MGLPALWIWTSHRMSRHTHKNWSIETLSSQLRWRIRTGTSMHYAGKTMLIASSTAILLTIWCRMLIIHKSSGEGRRSRDLSVRPRAEEHHLHHANRSNGRSIFQRVLRLRGRFPLRILILARSKVQKPLTKQVIKWHHKHSLRRRETQRRMTKEWGRRGIQWVLETVELKI